MEQDKKSVALIVEFFHALFEQKNIDNFSLFVSPELKFSINHEVWDYQQSLSYFTSLVTEYSRIEVLPFELILPCGDFVSISFAQKCYTTDGKVRVDKCMAMFEIDQGKICAIHQLTLPCED